MSKQADTGGAMTQTGLTICSTSATQQGQTAGPRTPKATAVKQQNAL